MHLMLYLDYLRENFQSICSNFLINIFFYRFINFIQVKYGSPVRVCVYKYPTGTGMKIKVVTRTDMGVGTNIF